MKEFYFYIPFKKKLQYLYYAYMSIKYTYYNVYIYSSFTDLSPSIYHFDKRF